MKIEFRECHFYRLSHAHIWLHNAHIWLHNGAWWNKNPQSTVVCMEIGRHLVFTVSCFTSSTLSSEVVFHGKDIFSLLCVCLVLVKCVFVRHHHDRSKQKLNAPKGFLRKRRGKEQSGRERERGVQESHWLGTCSGWCWQWGQYLVSGHRGCCSWAGVNFSGPSGQWHSKSNTVTIL